MAASSVSLFEAKYTYKDVIYNIVDTFETHQKLQNDNNFLDTYMKENSTPEIVGINDIPSITSNEGQMENLRQETSCETFQEGISKNFIWTRENTKYFLEKYAERKNDFRNPKIKKKTVWEAIQKELTSVGYSVTTEILDRKMRNMKHFFKTIKDNNKKSSTGRGRVQWEWFEFMEDIFLEDRTINIGNTIASLSSSSNLPELNSNTENSTMDTIEQQDTSLPAIEETSLTSTLISLRNEQMPPIPEIPSIPESSRCDKNEYLHRSSKLLIYTKNLFAFWFYMKSYFLNHQNDLGNNYLHKDFIQYVPLCYSLRSQSPAENRNNENRQQKSRRSKQLYELRKDQIESEKKRVEAINKLSAAIEESNSIEKRKAAAVEESNNIERQKIAAIEECNNLQRDRNKLFETLIELQRESMKS